MKITKRRIAIAAGAGVLLAGAGLALRSREDQAPSLSLPRTPAKRLNIQLLVTDQERAWGLLPKGLIEAHCPARTRLLAESVQFTQAHTPSPFCSMARSVIYTGQHP